MADINAYQREKNRFLYLLTKMNLLFLFVKNTLRSLSKMAFASTSNESKKIVWFWRSNANEEQEWKRYSDFENDFIEMAFQRKDEQVRLGD